MSQKVWLDGRLIPIEEANVPVKTHALHYGTGQFEGMKAYRELEQNGQPTDRWNVWLMRPHVDRLFRSAKGYGSKLPFTQFEVAQAILDTVSANAPHQPPGINQLYIRPLVFRGEGLGVNPVKSPVRLAVMTEPWGRYVSDFLHHDGATALISSLTRPPARFFAQGQLKGAAGYAIWGVMAKLEAIAAECSEAILWGEDANGLRSLVDGTGMNLFVVHRDERSAVTFTPEAVRWNILPGETQKFLIRDLTGADQIPVYFDKFFPKNLVEASEVFFSGTATEITPVTAIKFRLASGELQFAEVGNGHPGPITKQLREALLAACHGQRPEYRRCLTPVPSLATAPV